MFPARRFPKLLMPMLPPALAALVVLGVIALRQASSLGGPEFWLMAWTVGFVVGLPLAVVALAVAGAMQRRRVQRPIIPITGVKIPGAGQ